MKITSTKIGIILVMISLCGSFILFILALQLLDILPSTEESHATRTAKAVAITDSEQIATATVMPSVSPMPIDTLMPSATPSPTHTPPPSLTSTPEIRNSLTFNSQENGLQAVIGPVSIPSGAYRVTATTNGFFIGQIQTVSGTCNADTMGLFNLMQGIATLGAETLFTSENCQAIISVSNTQQPWTLDFSQILRDDIQTAETTYNSDDYGLYAVIGPLQFIDGRYRVTATTEKFLIAQIHTISGRCDDGIMGLFNLMQGQAVNGAQTLLTTKDCIGLVVISNTQSPWTLEFELLQ